MPIPSIDISYNEMLSPFIALPPLYRWNRYRAFWYRYREKSGRAAEASLAFILAVFRFASRTRALHRQRC